MIIKTQINKIKNKALSLQKSHNTKNPELIAKYLDIEILYRPYKKQLGAFTVINKVPFIFINENLTYEEKKLVIAHEVGHYVLHKNLLKDLLILRDYSLFSKHEKEIENEADLFSAYLLTDSNQFIELKKQNIDDKQIASTLNINPKLIKLLNLYN